MVTVYTGIIIALSKIDETVSLKAFFFNFCGDKSPFCGATGALCFGLRLILPVGFKARVNPSSTVLCSRLCVMILLRVNYKFPSLHLSQFYTLVRWGYRWSDQRLLSCIFFQIYFFGYLIFPIKVSCWYAKLSWDF